MKKVVLINNLEMVNELELGKKYTEPHSAIKLNNSEIEGNVLELRT